MPRCSRWVSHVSRIAKDENCQTGQILILLAWVMIERISICWRPGAGAVIHVAFNFGSVER